MAIVSQKSSADRSRPPVDDEGKRRDIDRHDDDLHDQREYAELVRLTVTTAGR